MMAMRNHRDVMLTSSRDVNQSSGVHLPVPQTAEPKNAAAAYYYGMTIRRRGDTTALDEAVPWLAKAAELEPTNATYLGDFGGSSLQLAGKTRSLSAATRGREAMIRAVELNPDYLDAREGLMQYYAQAP